METLIDLLNTGTKVSFDYWGMSLVKGSDSAIIAYSKDGPSAAEAKSVIVNGVAMTLDRDVHMHISEALTARVVRELKILAGEE